MHEDILHLIKEKILTRQYIMTLHADEEKDSDKLSIMDVEHCVFTGTIIEKQKDQVTGESKYKIKGKGMSGKWMELICKISPTGKLVIITVYLT